MAVSLNLVTFAAMNKKDKLVKRFRTLPRDFTFEEVVTLFQGYGFELANIIKGYAMRDILNFLIKNNYIK